MQALIDLTAGWLKPAVDIFLIVGITALWITWLRNGQRQKRLEALLLGCADQLEEATRHLNEATQTIERLRREPVRAPQSAPAPRAEQPRQNPPRQNEQALPPENSTQATMVLRMHREGEDAETIADKLDMPLAQVTLLLKLYAPREAS